MSTHDGVIVDGVLGSWQPPDTPRSDAAQQFARLFGHPVPKRARRKSTLRDGNSRVSKARGG